VSSEYSDQEQSLRTQVEQSEHVLDNLEDDLHTVDAELEALAQKHQKYEILADVCRSLEKLDNLGAAHLFWDEQGDSDVHAEHMRYARRKIDEFGEEVAQVETRRESIIEKIGDQNTALDYLHYDLQDVIEQEEGRRNEWLLEREASESSHRAQVMPWARGEEEDQRLRRSLASSLATSFAVALLLSVIAVPLVERADDNPVEELPPESLPESTEEPRLADIKQPDTREQVKSKGILAFRDSFASRADIRPSVDLGSQARVRIAGDDTVGRPERMMVTTSAPGSSGGINLASISRNVGGGGGSIDGVALSRVASSIGGGDGPGRPLSGGALAGRTDEEIQIVFDRYKAALYRLYNRELRKNPTLRGQLVLQLTIEPNGSVSLCQLHSSDMKAPLLANQVVERVRTFDFGAKEDIVAVTIIYPIDFLPAA
jgi:hypothetical protein